jgi:hypothetical protein
MRIEYETNQEDLSAALAAAGEPATYAEDLGMQFLLDTEAEYLEIAGRSVVLARGESKKIATILKDIVDGRSSRPGEVIAQGNLRIHPYGSYIDCVEIYDTSTHGVVLLPWDWLCRALAEDKSPVESNYLIQSREFLDKVMVTIGDKNEDYCSDHMADPLDNFRNSERMDVCSVDTAILSRLCDKFTRVKNLTKKGREAKVDESIFDTLQDMIGYTLLLAYSAREKTSD